MVGCVNLRDTDLSPTPQSLRFAVVEDSNGDHSLVEQTSNHVSEDIDSQLGGNSLENAKGLEKFEEKLKLKKERADKRNAEQVRPLRRGVLRVRITEFLNPSNKDADGDCCMEQSKGSACAGYCRLFFR